MAKSFQLPFIKKQRVAKDTYSFFFDRSQVEFDFLPGQYIRLTLPHVADDRGTSRYFTIASSPHEKDSLMLTVKIYESSFKRTLYGLKKGHSAEFFGPLGKFVLDEKEKRKNIFLAGGIGITTFHSMITYAHAKKLLLPITLVAAFSATDEIIFQKSLEKIAKKNQSITILYSLERISKELLTKYITDMHNHIYYIVGSPVMVQATRELLLAMDIDEEKIRFEDFTGY